MSRQYWKELLTWEVTDGTAIANTTTETIIYPNVTIPGNYMADGRALHLVVRGKHSVAAATTPTLTFRLRWGGVAGTVLTASGAMVTGSGVTNAMFALQLWIQTRVNGASGSLLVMGEAILWDDATTTVGSATNNQAHDPMGSAGVAAPAAVTVDLTADIALAISAQWGTASVSNTLTGMQRFLGSLN